MKTKSRTTLEGAADRKGVALFYLSESGSEQKDTNLFRKRVLYEGKFVHPSDPSKWLVITKEHLQDAVRNFQNKVMDKVPTFWTHAAQDPRNMAGEVVGLEVGLGEDGKESLYSLTRLDDPAAVNYAKENKGGVSVGMDHEYREHVTGNKVGLVIKHLALVPQGWIHKLGEFIPIPQSMSDAAVNLEETKADGVIFMGDEEQEEKEKTKQQEQEQQSGKKPESERKKSVDIDELKAEAQKLGLTVKPSSELTALEASAAQAASIRQSLGLSESDDLTTKVVERVNASDDIIKKIAAERAVEALLAENKITPALKDTFTQLYTQNKPLFETMVAQLKPGAVMLGESGTQTGEQPGQGKVDVDKEISRYLALSEENGIPVIEGKTDVSKKAVAGLSLN